MLLVINAAQPGVGRVQVLGSKKKKTFCHWKPWNLTSLDFLKSREVPEGTLAGGYPDWGIPRLGDTQTGVQGYPDQGSGGTKTKGTQTRGTS